MFKTVIWATDGSETADGALPFARALAHGDDRKLLVVHAKELFTGRARGFPVLADEADLEAKIRAQVDELRADGFHAKFEFVSGPIAEAAEMIADIASTTGADAIVVGTRGHGPVAGAIVGSVTQKLLHVSPCPIVAVPTAKQRQRVLERERATAAS